MFDFPQYLTDRNLALEAYDAAILAGKSLLEADAEFKRVFDTTPSGRVELPLPSLSAKSDPAQIAFLEALRKARIYTTKRHYAPPVMDGIPNIPPKCGACKCNFSAPGDMRLLCDIKTGKISDFFCESCFGVVSSVNHNPTLLQSMVDSLTRT
jgi:hypothetical protein